MTITNGYLTADEFRTYITPPGHDLNSSGPDDSVIDEIITAVSRYIDNQTGRTFYARTETRLYDLPYDGELLFDDDLQTITALLNGDGTTILATQYILYPANVYPKWALRFKESSTLSWEDTSTGNTEQVISVTGTWGWSTTAPADIKQCMYDICKSIYSRRYGDNVTADAIISPGGFVIEPRDMSASTRRTLLYYTRIC